MNDFTLLHIIVLFIFIRLVNNIFELFDNYTYYQLIINIITFAIEIFFLFVLFEIIELNCPECKKKSFWTKTQRVLNYPKYLIIVFQRFVFDWVPVKLEVSFEPTINKFDLKLLSQSQHKENEKILDTAKEEALEEEEEQEIQFNQDNVNYLLQCGIPELGAKWALYLSNNDPEAALGLYCENADNPEYKKPLPKIKAKKNKNKGEDDLSGVNMASVESLINMGFDRKKAIIALKKTNGNVDSAINLIFSEPNLGEENQNDQNLHACHSNKNCTYEN